MPAPIPHPEVSGSAFFTFALAWGINAGLLDRKTYEPVVAKAWKGLLGHIYADGRLGSMQKIGGAPGEVSPGGSYVYGVGAFLLAGSEVDKLAAASPVPRPRNELARRRLLLRRSRPKAGTPLRGEL